jgi:hypothetical protein
MSASAVRGGWRSPHEHGRFSSRALLRDRIRALAYWSSPGHAWRRGQHLATACHDVRQERVAVMRGSRYEVTGREAGTRSRGRDGQDIAASAWADCCS